MGLRNAAPPDHNVVEDRLIELSLDLLVRRTVGVGTVGRQARGEVEDRVPHGETGVGGTQQLGVLRERRRRRHACNDAVNDGGPLELGEDTEHLP